MGHLTVRHVEPGAALRRGASARARRLLFRTGMSLARRLGLALALALTPGAVASLAMLGCERSGPRPERQAQEEAGGARAADNSATLRRDGPGAGEALRDFAETRREFRAQTERDLVALDRSIASLEADAAAAGGEAKRELDASLVKAKAARLAVQENLAAADTVLEATWGSFKEKVTRHLGEARVSVETPRTPPR